MNFKASASPTKSSKTLGRRDQPRTPPWAFKVKEIYCLSRGPDHIWSLSEDSRVLSNPLHRISGLSQLNSRPDDHSMIIP